MSIFSYCPTCDHELNHTDSGEPDYIDGLECPECGSFWSDEEYAEIIDDLEAEQYADDDGHDDPHYPY